MIYGITGLPRNGKTYFLVRIILRELRSGKRKIYTNVPLLLENIRRWLIKNNLPESRLELLVILKPLECRSFFMHRDVPPQIGPSADLPLIYGPEQFAAPGCVYILSEVHLVGFDVMRFKEVDAACKFYISQHGKLGDDVYLETQCFDKVAKPLKLDIQYYYEIEYKRRQHILCFQKGYHFLAKLWTSGMPESDLQKKRPNNKFPFLPDAEIMGCYDTTAGHGMAGNAGVDGKGGNDGQKFKGFAPWVGYLIVAGALFVAVKCALGAPAFLMRLLPSHSQNAGKNQKNDQAGKSSNLSGALGGFGAAGAAPGSSGEVPFDVVTQKNAQKALVPAPLRVRGIIRMGYRFNVYLSDGRVLTETDGVVFRLARNFVELKDGTRLHMDETSPVRLAAATAVPSTSAKTERGGMAAEVEKPGEDTFDPSRRWDSQTRTWKLIQPEVLGGGTSSPRKY